MSIYTDSVSRPGIKGASGTDDRELFLTEFGGLVITTRDEVLDYGDMRWVKNITQGKSDTFPIIGRKRDATEHVAGELIVGGKIEHNEVEITLDTTLIDSVFIAEIDELIAHFDVAAPYAKQIGQSLGSTDAKRIAIMHILASRDVANVAQGQPTPQYYWAADLKTNAAKIEEAYFVIRQWLLEQDMSGEQPLSMLPHQQILLLARYTGVEGGPVTTGSGNRSTGTIGLVGGLASRGTNHIPKTNITAGNAKYRGNFTDTVGHVSSKMAVGSLERRGLKIVMKEQEDRLGTLIIGSQLNGHGKLRGECSIELRTSAIGGRAPITG